MEQQGSEGKSESKTQRDAKSGGKRKARGGLGMAVAIAVVLVIVIGGAAAFFLLAPSGPCGTQSYNVTDDRGKVVCLERTPSRVASLSPSTTEIVCAVGLCAKLVALDNNSNYPPEANNVQIRVYGYGWFDREGLKASRPDVVFASGINKPHYDVIERDMGLKLVVLDPKDLDGMLKSLRTAGTAGNVAPKANEVATALQGRIDALKVKIALATSKPKVYHELDGSTGTFYSIGPGSFGDSLITAGGGMNIVPAESTAYPALTSEDIVAANPDLMTCSANIWYKCDPTEVAGRAGWGNITAVKNGRIVNLDSDLIDRPGPRLVDGLEAMAKAIHPELFP
jgi:iron complex transport system substrate-binding protein